MKVLKNYSTNIDVTNTKQLRLLKVPLVFCFFFVVVAAFQENQSQLFIRQSNSLINHVIVTQQHKK